MSGRRPKPTKLKLLSGNPGRRKLNSQEAEPKSAPTCPEWLSGDAKTEWLRLAPELESLGLLSNIDVTGLAAYCQAFERWRMADEQLRQNGLVTVSSKSGFEIKSPYVAISNTTQDQMRKFLVEFGCTPAARSKVVVTKRPTEEESRWAKFLDGAH